MDQIWANITASDWMGIASYIVEAICFILSCIFLISSKVNALKLQAQNEKLQEQSNLSEQQYKEKELALRKEYSDQLESIKKQIISNNQDLAAKKEEKQKEESLKIASDIKAAQKDIDEIINPK